MTNKIKAQLAVVAAVLIFTGAALLAGNPVFAMVIVGISFLFLACVFADLIKDDRP